MGECVKKYTNTKIVNDKQFEKASRTPFFKSAHILSMENGEHDFVEISMQPKKIKDDKPITMATAILQNSKLHFLTFVYDVLWTYFKPGSIVLNYCDTDSLCLSTMIYLKFLC